MRRELVILLVLCSVFLAIGCAEDGAEEPEPAETPAEELVDEAGTPVEEPVEPVREEAVPEETPILPVQGEMPGTSNESGVTEVSIVNSSFNPETVTVSAGETVRWTNLDPIAHTVKGTGTSFGSPSLAQGGSYEFLFTDPGTYEYYCSIHPSMRGTVIVVEEE
ncbi:Copper binding protein, plastocyanin/azurin family [Methanosarcina horonobensis HB-1 = JCM 15518]|uniref:Copper binding protein, plastocyanin/azurin family n=1 Tax=Methanosarcina horonobensis HB-1 = JCM 15518 TaxID=1434110 RepID=A0A0E3SEQ5_9EURY|nr:cupredoxin family copper-binding protein [Methanosarcina horonobensis]AKB79461.1 Copper binding protein, plastocyanin/azurin family [Methanosarcina horonobensis HB-1 = JCM 15518]